MKIKSDLGIGRQKIIKIPPILKTIQKEHIRDFTAFWEFLNPSVTITLYYIRYIFTIWGHPVLYIIYIHNLGSPSITYYIYSQFGVTLYYISYIFTIRGHPVLHIIYIHNFGSSCIIYIKKQDIRIYVPYSRPNV